ncbi:MAG: CsgG/HfaB family protein, partial [Candidatus Desantisbacteria bacterium]
MWQRILTVCLCFLISVSIAQAGVVNEATAAKTGKLLGAQLLIKGLVTEFEEKANAGGIGGLSFAGIAGGVKFSQAHVAIDVRVFDTTSGVILHAHTADKKTTNVGFALAGLGKGAGLAAGWETKTPLGKATRQAIVEIVKVIVEESEKLPWQASIISIKPDDAAYLNIGQKDGLKTGAVFDVYRQGEELIDPDTGLSLGSEDTKIGQIELTEVKEKFSIAKIKEGSGFVKGDIARLTNDGRKYTPKKRIAVAGFECKVSISGYDLGSAMSEMLVTSLVATNKFIVVERQALDDILKEQSLGKETPTPPAPLPSTTEVSAPAAVLSPALPGQIMQRYAAACFGYAFYAGGYWLGSNPFQPGEWTEWKVTSGNEVHEMEKAFLVRTEEGKEWWRISMSGKKAEEEVILEALFSAERTSLRRLRGKFSNQEPGEIPV